ncbi:ABC transporter substrate-binding protein [Nocardioides sp.]|uniref:ABC transporter substrate-binding protein n=1 Tax=Nocardioides sp. TaxID=35761 RepID=UPI003526C603
MAAAAGLLLAALAPAVALGQPAGAAEDKVVFTVGLDNEVDSFNPFLGIEAPSFEMWALEYDYLIGYSMSDMQPEPGLATKWETSDDGLTWTFTIRDDVTWSDGEPLTADDVAFTLNRILDGGPEAATWGSYLKGTKTITATDPTTVVLELKQPNAVLPLLPMPIVPEHIWKDIDEKAVKTFANEPGGSPAVVGSGPFRMVSGTAGGSEYRFEANPDYWKGAPHIDEIVFKVYKAKDPMIAALKKGEIDFAENLNALQVQALQNEPNIEAINGDSPGFDEIAFNTGAIDTGTGKPIGDGNAVLKDPKFRHALGYAVNLDEIIEKAYYGAGKPGDTIVPPAYANWKWTPEGDQAFTFDLDKAGQLLDEAGYTMGSDGKRTTPDGKPIGTLRLMARADSETSLKVLTFFSEWLGELGIDSKVSSIEEGKLTDVILSGDFDIFEWGWYVEPDPDSMLSYMTCGQLGNWSDSWYCNKEYDALYDQQHSETDDAARVEEVKQMQQIVFDDSPYLVTAYNTVGEAFRTDRFACMRPQPDPGGIYIFQYGVYNYLHMRPAAEADQCEGEAGVTQASDATESSSGPGTGVLVGGGIAAVAALAAIGFVMARRRSTAGDRE